MQIETHAKMDTIGLIYFMTVFPWSKLW